MAPSTFASAAAGNHSSQNITRDAASEWSRRTNGATQTFRRASGTPTTATAPPANDVAPSQSARYVPPHRNGTASDTRYTKEQLFDLYRSHHSSLNEGLPNLYIGGWHPDSNNSSSVAWGKSDSARDAQPSADVCWDSDAGIEPLGLIEMDDEEKELFTTSVNTPIKPPTTTGKDGQATNGHIGRKVSISTGAPTPGAYGLPSPGVTRGAGRRRDTSESYPFPQNQSGNSGGFERNEQRATSPPPALLRRRTDHRELPRPDNQDGDDKASGNPFGTLKRLPTGQIATGFGSASPWSAGPNSAALSPMGTFGSFASAGASGSQGILGDKRPGIGSGRTESRFKNLLSKDSHEDVSLGTGESKSGHPGAARQHQDEQDDDDDDSANPAEDSVPAGSASLVADADLSPPQQRQAYRGFGTPHRQGNADGNAFAAFGMNSTMGGFGSGFAHHQQTPAHQRNGPGHGNGNEPMSPTDTNPYQSPDQNNVIRTHEDSDLSEADLRKHLAGLGGSSSDLSGQPGILSGLGALPSHALRGPGPVGPASDRSQTSSVAPGRGFPTLSGLGQLGGGPGSNAWPGSQGAIGTPTRQAAGLSNVLNGGVFGNSMSDLHSPGGFGGLGSSNLIGSSGAPFGGSRMASVFPQAMQDQMRQPEHKQDDLHDRVGAFAGLGELGRSSDSPFNNSSFGEGHQDQGPDSQTGQFSGLGQQMGQLDLGSHPHGQSQVLGSSASNQPPAPQQRTMVMPDRMRWIYRDPQGQTQGPWSGLEMHDWYKAGFFSPELLVKKYEDQDYEPLAQLIRRIGNSREPFLVPQIGIPHGAPSGSGPNAWAGTASLASNGAAPIGGAQPPFASSFPSFGTTLTADQQNALERRKQEEQYLMARQKEHLAQAQMSQRFQMQGVGHPGLIPGQLHHHSSAHSLHSQQSFGSITGPGTGYQQGPPAAAHQPGFFDNSFRAPQPIGAGTIGSGVDALGQIREEDPSGLLGRSTMIGNRAGPGQFGAPGQPAIGQQQSLSGGKEPHDDRVQQMLQDRARLEQEQADFDAQNEDDDEADESNDRLQEFEQLQSREENIPATAGKRLPQVQAQRAQAESSASQSSISSPVHDAVQAKEQFARDSITKTAEPGLPQPFPAPAVAKMPLAAPEPQRPGRPIVAEHLQQEPRDHSETPSVEAKIAPWANKEVSETTKGPSLKEIQEMEAKQAAKAEELAIAARRAALQKAMEAEAQAAIVQPGLPAASNWATGSPATPTGPGPAAWAKTAQKTAGPAQAKSMAQIQKEEEARKRKLAAAAALSQTNSTANVAVASGGKSYANLAGKVSLPTTGPTVGGAWTTVGASGKVKTPLPAAPSTGSRAVSASILPTVQSAASAAVRKVPSRSSTLLPGAVNAQDEFKKWAANELRPDLSKGILAEDFVSSLTMLPAESDIITEAVHGASSTLDSRHFAEEFLRRKKLADKGLVDAAPLKSASPHHAAGEGKAGGWNEVAKKGPSGGLGKEIGAAAGGKEDAAAAAAGGNGMFRVVPAKKKGGKR